MSRFRCFDTYNLQNTSSSDYITGRKRKTIFTEYQTIAIGNVNFQKGLTENVIPPGYLRKDNGAHYYGPVYVTTDDIAVNNCLIGAKNYELLYDVLFGAQPSPDDVKNLNITYNGDAWQGNILKTDFQSIGNIGPAISNTPNGYHNKMNYAARQDFLPKYDDNPNPPDAFPGIIIDPCYNIFYPRCNTTELGNNYIKNVKFNLTAAQFENTELVNYIRKTSSRQYKKFPYQLNFQNTTCEKYPFTFIFSFINNSNETAEDILNKYMPLINLDNTITYDIEYIVSGLDYKSLTFSIRFKYTGVGSTVDGLTFYPQGSSNSDLVDFYNTFTTNLTIEMFDLIPLSPLGGQFENLNFIISANDIPLIKPSTSLERVFKGTNITLTGDSISKWRTAGVINMNSAFMNSNFNGEINNWNTSNVINMVSIFENNTSFNQSLDNWDINKITSMSRMFYGASSFNQSIDSWDTSNVINMRNLFTGAYVFDQSLNNWNTSSVRDMSGMFMDASGFNGNIRTWNTEQVKTMNSMFKNAESFNRNISYDNFNNYWNTFNVETFESIFEDTIVFNDGEIPLPSTSAGITEPLNWINIYNFLPTSGFPNTLNITLNSISNSSGLTRENAFPFLKPSIFLYEFYDNVGTSAADICNNYLPIIINGSSQLSDVSIIPFAPTPGYRTVSFSFLYNTSDTNSGLSFYSPSDTKVNFYNNVGNNNPIRILEFNGIPLAKNGYQFSKLYNLDISSTSFPSIYFNTSLSNAFNESYKFNSSNLTFWNVSNVIDMSSMLKDTSFNRDISGWITNNVVNMSSMFENNDFFNQDLSEWNTSKVTNMSNMFKNASAFNSSLQYNQVNNYWDVSSVTNMTSMFQNAASFNDGESSGGTTQPLNWILNPMVTLTNVRTGATILTNENAYPLPSLYTLIYEFYNNPIKTNQDISNNVPILITSPLSSIITTSVNTSTLTNYKTVSTTASFPNHVQDLSSGISFVNVYSFFNSTDSGSPHIITQFGGMPLARNDNSGNPNGYQFANLLNVIDFSVNDVPSILPNTTLSYCFYQNYNFNSPLNWDTNEVTSMASMFEDAQAFDRPLNFITNKVTNMENMFKGAATFNKQISYVSGPYWDVSSVINMISIFENASTFNNGFSPGDTSHPLNWILNLNVNTTNCITNATNLTFENAYPLAEIYDRFNYTFYNTQNLSAQDISNLYLPIIKTSDVNLNYYYPPLITTNLLDNSFTTVTVYFRYNNNDPNIIDGLSFNNVYMIYNDNTSPKTITNFGNIPLAKNNGSGDGKQFSNINNLIFNTSSKPAIVSGTTFKNIFTSSNFNSDISGWDTSNVVSLNGAFSNTSFNKDLNNWNTSNVTDMSGTFYNNSTFNEPIGNWDISNVTTMENMFKNSLAFNQDISGWQTKSLTNMTSMFYNSTNFNKYLTKWDTSKVVSFKDLFYNSINFNNGDTPGSSNNPLSWNTNALTNLSGTFYSAISFNQDISGWNTSNVTTMEGLFEEMDYFNQPIGAWNVTNVTNMKNLFNNSIAFNQDISEWDTGNVTTMERMFNNALSFNKQVSYLPSLSLTNWDTSNVISMVSLFEGALEFNNGFGEGDIDNSLNWILNPVVNTTNAVLNTPKLTAVNAQPLSKIINGKFIYTFYNTDKTDQDISDNYIPIINSSGSFTTLLTTITHPLSPSDPSFTYVDVSFSYLDQISTDGLSFYDTLNSKVDFYNSTSNRIKIIQFGGIPISRSTGNNTGYQFANLLYLDMSNNYSDSPTILTNTLFDHAFYKTPSFNSGNIENWETVFVINTESMFEDSSFNQSLRMNTKNVTNMKSMFKNAINFNQNISYQSSSNVNIWNTTNVTNMIYMLDSAVNFNNGQVQGGTTRPLNWILNPTLDISFVRINTPFLTNQNAFPLPSIYELKYNFYDNTGVSGEYIINNYIPIIVNGKSMFYKSQVTPATITSGNKSVNVELAYLNDLSNTGLSFYTSDNSITNFYNNNNSNPLIITQFNNIPLARNDGSGNPNGYQFANLNWIDFSSNDKPMLLPNTTLSYCFYNSPYFNTDISGWNTINVTSTASMFENDFSFNQPLQYWNTSNITDMERMFKNSSSFNQPIKYIPSLNYWNVNSVTNMVSLFEGAINFNNGFPQFNFDNSLNWILNGSVDITNAVLNTPKLTDYNGLPLTNSIYYPNEFIYNFYNTNGETIENILLKYLPFIKTNKLVFDITKNINIQLLPGPSAETIVTTRFSFTDDGITQDGLSFNATQNIAYFYNKTQEPVEIIKFGGMPLSRYYKNLQQSFWETTEGVKFNSFGYTVANGNNKWVSVGGPVTNTILRSIDGITWSTVSAGFAGLGYDVLYGTGTTWIAVGDDYGGTNTILSSYDDGISWNTVSGTRFSYAGYGLAYGNSRWVAVGDDNGGVNTILFSSDNGVNWGTVSGAFTIAGFGVTYDGISRWVAVGAGTNSILTSTNGTTWNSTSVTQFSSYGQSVLYDGSGRWIAIGYDNGGTNTILTSTDGINWSSVSGTTFSSYGQNLAYGNGRWVAVGYDNGGLNTILSSADGQTWYPCSGGFTFAGYGISYDILTEKWIAVGDNNGNSNTILTSTDGIKWFPVKGTRFNLVGYGVSSNNNGEWVAVGYDTSSNNTILYSSE